MTKKVYFKTPDNFKLCGIWNIPNKKTNKAVILAHGLNADKNEGGVFTKLANALAKQGFAVFRFDFRGRGESEGITEDVSTKNEVVDLNAALDFTHHNSYRTIGLLGASYSGASTTLFTATNPNKVKCLCLWNPGLNNRHVLTRITVQEVLKLISNLEKKGLKKSKARKISYLVKKY